jgi:Gram-negative bacterial TonB protein C-terminal
MDGPGGRTAPALATAEARCDTACCALVTSRCDPGATALRAAASPCKGLRNTAIDICRAVRNARRMRRPGIGVLAAVVAAWGAVAAADDQLTGFTTDFQGDLSGVVTDLEGHPLHGEAVHVASAAGEQVVRTDRAGRYHVLLSSPGSKTIYVRRVARIIGQTGVSSMQGGEEVFEIQETLPPKVMPKPLSRTDVIPAYSAEARGSDAWTKTWMMLDVDIAGTVARVQVLKPAGFGLDAEALRAAFQQRFAPARDQGDRPVPAMVLWSFEWPSYEWLTQTTRQAGYLPAEVKDVPCRALPSSTHLRDCEPPDLIKGVSQPWIARPAELATADVAATSTPARSANAAATFHPGPRREPWYRDNVGWVFVGAGLTMSAAGLYFILDGAGSHGSGSSGGEIVAGYFMGAIGVSIFTVGAVRFAVHSDGSSTSMLVAGRF